MQLSGFKRVKHGQEPGDIPKADKIQLRENPSSSPQAKGFSKMVKGRTKAALRERTRKIIEEAL